MSEDQNQEPKILYSRCIVYEHNNLLVSYLQANRCIDIAL
jgi:hypothetical protein